MRADNDEWRTRQRRGDDMAETSNDNESKRGAGKKKHKKDRRRGKV